MERDPRIVPTVFDGRQAKQGERAADAPSAPHVTGDIVEKVSGDPLTQLFDDGSPRPRVVPSKSVVSAALITVERREVSQRHVRFAYSQSWHASAHVVVFRRDGIGAGADRRSNTDDGVRIDCDASAIGEVVDPTVEPGKFYYYTFEVRRPRSRETIWLEAKARFAFRRTPFHVGDYLYAGEAGTVGIQVKTLEERVTEELRFAENRTQLAGKGAEFSAHLVTIKKNEKLNQEMSQTPEEELALYALRQRVEAEKRRVRDAIDREYEEKMEAELRRLLREIDADPHLTTAEKEVRKRRLRSRFERPAEEA